MADPKVASGGGIDLQGLATLLGGTKTTTNPGNTAALEQTLSGLKGQDGEALLKSIFQRAGGEIPGLQQALGNAIGARSGGNSAVQAALQSLLSQTTLAGQKQLADQQTANFQTQVQAGNSIANATKGTRQQSGTNIGGAAKNLAILSLLQKSGLMEKLGFGDKAKAATPLSTPEANTPLLPGDGGNFDLSGGGAPQADYVFGADAIFGGDAPVFSGAGSNEAAADSNYLDFGAGADADFQPDYSFGAGAMDSFVPSSFDFAPEQFDLNFADGGKVSAGASKNFGSEDMEDSREGAVSKMMLKHMNEMGKMLMEHSKPEGAKHSDDGEDYADGGRIRAGGSRVSANPRVALAAPQQSQAKGVDSLLRSSLGGSVGSTFSAINPSELARAFAGGGGGGQGLTSSAGGAADTSGPGGAAISKDTARTISTLNALSGLTGGASVPGLGGMLGLASARNNKEALTAVGTTAANMAVPGLGSAIGLAMDPTRAGAIDLATAFNPATATINALMGMFGTSLGTVADNALDMANPNMMMTPEQQAIDAAFRAGGGGSGGIVGDRGPGGSSGEAGAAAGGATAAGPGGYGDSGANAGSAGGGGGGGGGGYGSGSHASGSGGTRGADRGPGGGPSGSSRSGMANGGPVNGPGSGIADKVKANLSDGEFVISADVVDSVGEEFFNALQAAFHTPAAVQRANGQA